MARKILPSATSFSPINQDLETKLVNQSSLHIVLLKLPMLLPKGKQFTDITRVRIVKKACRLPCPWMPQPHHLCLDTKTEAVVRIQDWTKLPRSVQWLALV